MFVLILWKMYIYYKIAGGMGLYNTYSLFTDSILLFLSRQLGRNTHNAETQSSYRCVLTIDIDFSSFLAKFVPCDYLTERKFKFNSKPSARKFIFKNRIFCEAQKSNGNRPQEEDSVSI